MRFARAVFKMLQNHGGVIGASCTFRGHLALSERTSLRHRVVGKCIFVKFWMVVARVDEEPTQYFRPIGGRLAGEPAFRKMCEGLEVTSRISYWNGRRCGAPIGLKLCVKTFLG